MRFACPSYICVHFIGWPSEYDEKLTAKESARVAHRGTHTNGPRRRNKSGRTCYPALELPVVAMAQSFAMDRLMRFNILKPPRGKGVIKRFIHGKCYGFKYIACDDGLGDVFVHETELYADGFRLVVGEPVEFDIRVNRDLSRWAANVTRPNGIFVNGQTMYM